MRKWAVIALVSIGLAGVFAVLANRETRSVEELKTRYNVTCSGRIYVWTEDLRQKWSRFSGIRADPKAARERDGKRIEKCESALVKVGYLEKRRFVVSNLPAETVLWISGNEWFIRFPAKAMSIRHRVLNGILLVSDDQVIARLQPETTNIVVVVAPKKDMPKWEKIVRREDLR